MKPCFFRKKTAGFTLIEMLAVVTVIGILISLAGHHNTITLKKARDASLKIELNLLRTAVHQFALDNNGRFPESLQNLSPDYLKKVDLSWNGAESAGSFYYDSSSGLVNLFGLENTESVSARDCSGNLYADY